jgi:hypothetical protein
MTRGCPSLVTTFAIFPNAEMTASARPVQTKPKRNFLSHQCTPTEAEKGAQAMTVEGRSMLKRAEKAGSTAFTLCGSGVAPSPPICVWGGFFEFHGRPAERTAGSIDSLPRSHAPQHTSQYRVGTRTGASRILLRFQFDKIAPRLNRSMQQFRRIRLHRGRSQRGPSRREDA